MKKLVFIYTLICILFLQGSCKKEFVDSSDFSANLTLVNAIASAGYNVNMNFTGKPVFYSSTKNLSYSYFDGINTNGALSFGIETGVSLPLKVVLKNDTTKEIYNRVVKFNRKDSFSLFLTGRAGAIDTILVKDIFPTHTDSTTAVRFVHLGPGASPISVNLINQPNGNLIENLPYKGVSEFKKLPATSNVTSYVFQIRNAETGALIRAYTYNNIGRLKNITLIYKTSSAVNTTYNFFRINNY